MVKINSKSDITKSLLASLVKSTSDLHNPSTVQCFPSASYGTYRLISAKIKKSILIRHCLNLKMLH